MAEILLKIGPGSGYSDGDVLCAFNRRNIRCVHAQHLCHLDTIGHNSDGWRPIGCLAEKYREHTHQFKFQRVSEKTIERIELASGKVEEFGPESIDVALYLKRRRSEGRHAIFGTAGAEYWYGGRIDFSNPSLDKVWNAITASSGRLESEAEFQLWPMGRFDIRHHLAVRVDEFTDEEAIGLVSPQYELDQDGKPVLDAEEKPKQIARRVISVDWRNSLLDDLGVTEAQVLDHDFPVGREVVMAADKMRYESKPQPIQNDPAKLTNKASGKPIERNGNAGQSVSP